MTRAAAEKSPGRASFLLQPTRLAASPPKLWWCGPRQNSDHPPDVFNRLRRGVNTGRNTRNCTSPGFTASASRKACFSSSITATARKGTKVGSPRCMYRCQSLRSWQASMSSLADLTSLERGGPEQDLQRRLVGKQCDKPWCGLTAFNASSGTKQARGPGKLEERRQHFRRCP